MTQMKECWESEGTKKSCQVHTHIHASIHTNIHTHRQTDIHACMHACRQTDRQTDRIFARPLSLVHNNFMSKTLTCALN